MTVTLPVGPRPLTATLSTAELTLITPALDEAVSAWQRQEFSRPGFATAMRDALGRDPFRQIRAPRGNRRAVLQDASFIFVSLVFFSNADKWWWQALGLANAAFWAVDLVHELFLLRADRKDPAVH